jgi:hypothetical protein
MVFDASQEVYYQGGYPLCYDDYWAVQDAVGEALGIPAPPRNKLIQEVKPKVLEPVSNDDLLDSLLADSTCQVCDAVGCKCNRSPENVFVAKGAWPKSFLSQYELYFRGAIQYNELHPPPLPRPDVDIMETIYK